jgi:hypothetical protein
MKYIFRLLIVITKGLLLWIIKVKSIMYGISEINIRLGGRKHDRRVQRRINEDLMEELYSV